MWIADRTCFSSFVQAGQGYIVLSRGVLGTPEESAGPSPELPGSVRSEDRLAFESYADKNLVQRDSNGVG